MATPATISYRDCSECEREEYFPARWMGLQAQLAVPMEAWRGRRFASLPVWAGVGGGRQVLTIASAGHDLADLSLLERWHVYDFPLDAAPLHLAMMRNASSS